MLVMVVEYIGMVIEVILLGVHLSIIVLKDQLVQILVMVVDSLYLEFILMQVTVHLDIIMLMLMQVVV